MVVGTMSNYAHSKHHKLDDRSLSNLDSIDTLMDSLEVLTKDPTRSQQALQLLNHMRIDYTRLDLRSASAVENYIRGYETRYKQLVEGK